MEKEDCVNFENCSGPQDGCCDDECEDYLSDSELIHCPVCNRYTTKTIGCACSKYDLDPRV